jgi:hypothetical protein
MVSAIDRDGTFLDVGCANGLLMESLATWAGEEDYRVEPYSLDLIGSLAALAHQRLLHWLERVFVGNVMDWRVPFRFDLVRTDLKYAPPHRRHGMVERLLREYLSSGGRLILCSYGSSRRPTPKAEPVGEILRNWGYTVAGEAAGVDTNGVVFTRVAWTEVPET